MQSYSLCALSACIIVQLSFNMLQASLKMLKIDCLSWFWTYFAQK